MAAILSTGMMNGMVDDKILNAFDFVKNGFSEMEKLWKDEGWVGKAAPIVISLLLLAVLVASIVFIAKGLTSNDKGVDLNDKIENKLNERDAQKLDASTPSNEQPPHRKVSVTSIHGEEVPNDLDTSGQQQNSAIDKN